MVYNNERLAERIRDYFKWKLVQSVAKVADSLAFLTMRHTRLACCSPSKKTIAETNEPLLGSGRLYLLGVRCYYGYTLWYHQGGAHMIKKLTKHGNSLALVIDRGVLDLLEIDAETPLNIKTDGKCLIVMPAQDAARQKKFRAALAKVNRQYGPALKKLAQ